MMARLKGGVRLRAKPGPEGGSLSIIAGDVMLLEKLDGILLAIMEAYEVGAGSNRNRLVFLVLHIQPLPNHDIDRSVFLSKTALWA